MEHKKITGQDILKLGFTQGKAVGVALDVVHTAFPENDYEGMLKVLSQVLATPEKYTKDKQLAPLANELLKHEDEVLPLRDTPDPYKIYGVDGIEQGALSQIDTAMRLPVARAGALMADAHPGYGLPIGGVLATENAVIPYGVGVDIGCRMCMTIYDMPESVLDERKDDLKKMLVNNSRFGRATFDKPRDHEVLESSLFNELDVVRKLKDRAAAQIGSSGGGNHFVEFGVTEIKDSHNELGLAAGRYLALLSHSGSRGLGASIANYYTKLAMQQSKLPKEARHLAWLDLDTEEGQAYWLAMNLAGDYASACHHQIHERMAVGLWADPVVRVENHHNFAWKEKDRHGNEIIVHRKGATPAGKGVLGIIPGSMTAPGFIVRGKGDISSLNSAAHGAGRVMSRTRAKQILNPQDVNEQLHGANVELIGAGLDEAPMAYKDIMKVMEAQKDLVDVVGVFQPRIVRMCGDTKFREVD
ncbi:MAG: RtcB family protein [Cyclobacteriaceae bacterium]